MAGAVRFARAAIPRMVTLSTPTSPTMDLAAFRIRNRVRSLMLAAYRGGPTKPRGGGGKDDPPGPLAVGFGEQRSLPRRAPVNNVHLRLGDVARRIRVGERCSPGTREEVNGVHQSGHRGVGTFVGSPGGEGGGGRGQAVWREAASLRDMAIATRRRTSCGNSIPAARAART